MITSILKYIHCPECMGTFNIEQNKLSCNNCSNVIPVVDGIPRFEKNITKPLIEFDETLYHDPTKWSKWRKLNVDFILEHLDKLPCESFGLDLGAGRRPFSQKLSRLVILSVDQVPYNGINLITDIDSKLPINNNVFDFIVLSNLLNHIKNPIDMLSECYRILKPNGILIGVTPFIKKIQNSPSDFYRYTDTSIHKVLSESGFKKNKVSHIGNLYSVNDLFLHSFYKRLLMKNTNRKISWLIIKFFERSNKLLIRLLIFLYAKQDSLNKTDDIPLAYGFIANKK